MSVLTLPMLMVVVLVLQRTVLLRHWCWFCFNCYFYTWPNPKNLWLPLCKPLTQQHGIEAYGVLRGVCHVSMWLDPLEVFRMAFSIGKSGQWAFFEVTIPIVLNNSLLFTFKPTVLYITVTAKGQFIDMRILLCHHNSPTCQYIMHICTNKTCLSSCLWSY